MVDYTWVAWFKELATKIARNGERDLADKAKAVDWMKDNVPLLKYEDENIDPMSFLYFLAQKNTKNQYEGVFGSVHEVFGITSDFPEIQPFIPAGQPHIKSLFHQYLISEAIVQRRPDTLLPDTDLRWLALQQIERHMTNHSHIMRRVASTNPTLVLTKRHVQSPVQLILDSPVRTHRSAK